MIYLTIVAPLLFFGFGVSYLIHFKDPASKWHVVPISIGFVGLVADAILYLFWLNPRIEIHGDQIIQYNWIGRERRRANLRELGYVVEDVGWANLSVSTSNPEGPVVRVRALSGEFEFTPSISNYDLLRDILSNPDEWLSP